MNSKFLPMCKSDLVERGWDSVDIILVSGDAYVDHPSFAAAILGRWLEKYGYKVGISAQPDWRKDDDFLKLGRPNLFFGVTAGNLDSLVANRTSDKRPRREDMYSPGGVAGKRPDRAVTVYCNALKKLFKDVPLVLGGIEVSLRRISHYDYWSDSIRRPILFDTRAEILVYGMGEKAILQIADKLRHHEPLVDIPNTAY
ncbi:MAG: YgiQ family radical SAM protein, partial [Candidatus Riflemargulisbacteria bacterium]